MSLTPEQIEENWNKFYGLGPHAAAHLARDAAHFANSSCAGERELQLTHLKELHAREEQA